MPQVTSGGSTLKSYHFRTSAIGAPPVVSDAAGHTAGSRAHGEVCKYLLARQLGEAYLVKDEAYMLYKQININSKQGNKNPACH